MARQVGVIQFEGTLGDLSGVQTKDGILLKRKGGVSKEKFNSSPSMERTRENASEFGRAAQSGKLFRDSMRVGIAQASDGRMVSRMTQKMREVIAQDAVNVRGQRGILDDECSLLEGFDFNGDSGFGSVVYVTPTTVIDRITGNVQAKVPAHSARISIAAPQGATHFKFFGCASAVNFEGNTFEGKDAESDFISLTNNAVAETTLELDLSENVAGPIFVGLGIAFYQEVNTIKYPLKNGSYNAFKVIKVDV